MEKLLTHLDQIWSKKAPESYATLQEPFLTDQFKKFTALYKNEIPIPVQLLFEWKGGQSTIAEKNMLPDWRLMQFVEIIMEYQSTLELFEMGEFEKANWWRPEWIPLFVNGEGAILCYDPAGVFEGQPGQMIYVSLDDSNRSIWFPSLKALIKASIQFLESDEEQLQFPPGYPIVRRV